MSNAALQVARTGLDAQNTKMRVIANNLANVNTTGFKRDRADFATLAYQNIVTPGAPADAQNRYASGVQLGTGVKLSGIGKIAAEYRKCHGSRDRRGRIFSGRDAGRHDGLYQSGQFQPDSRRHHGHQRWLATDPRDPGATRRDRNYHRQ